MFTSNYLAGSVGYQGEYNADLANQELARNFLGAYGSWLDNLRKDPQYGDRFPKPTPPNKLKAVVSTDGNSYFFTSSDDYVADYPAPPTPASTIAEFGGPVGVPSPYQDGSGKPFFCLSQKNPYPTAALYTDVTVNGATFLLSPGPFPSRLWKKLN